MFKKHLLILLAAGLIASTATFAVAQDSPANDQPSSPQSGYKHRMPDPAKRTQELTKKLKLTSDQQPKVQDALQSEHSQMESLRQDSSLSQQDRRTKMMDIRSTTDTQIRSLLDSTQQKKWDEMQAKHGKWGQKGSSGSPDASTQQAPPPQQ